MRGGWTLVVALAGLMAGCGDSEGAAAGGSGGEPSGGSGGSAGCSDGLVNVEGACVEPPAPCPEGFGPPDEGPGCAPVFAEDCAAGSAPQLGADACQPIGNTTCADGFAPDASGWGCAPVLPTSDCTGPTRAALGSSSCTAIACTAVFPPPDATFFVDDDFGPAQLDDTHFADLAGAVSAAPSGAVIAVSAGVYAGGITLGSGKKIVGQCAASVRIGDSAMPSSSTGVVLSDGASIAGVEITGHSPGVVADGGTAAIEHTLIREAGELGIFAVGAGTSLSVSDVAVENTTPSQQGAFGWGIQAEDGAAITLTDVDVRASREKGIGAAFGATLSMERSVVRGTSSSGLSAAVDLQGASAALLRTSAIVDNAGYGVSAHGLGGQLTLDIESSVVASTSSIPNGSYGRGIDLGGGVSFTADETTLRDNREIAIASFGAGTTVELRAVTVHQTLPSASGLFGAALTLQGGAVADLSDSALVDQRYYGVLAAGPDAHATLTRTLIKDTLLDPTDGIGNAVDLRDGATLTMGGGALLGSAGPAIMIDGATGPSQAELDGVLIADGGDVGLFHRLGGESTAHRCAIVRTEQAAVYLSDSQSETGDSNRAQLADCAIAQTKPHSSGTLGPAIVTGGEVIGERLTLSDNTGFGALVASSTGRLLLLDSTIRTSVPQPLDDLYGHGVGVLDGALFQMIGGEVWGNRQVGITIESSAALIDGVRIANNAVGVHVQGSSELVEADEATDPQAGEVIVTGETSFEDNDARFGTGTIAMPSVGL